MTNFLVKHYRITWALLLALLLPALACNLPSYSGGSAGITSNELRQTLDAQYIAATQGTPAATITPQPTGAYQFIGLHTATPVASVQETPLPTQNLTPEAFTVYPAQPGDTLEALAPRFAVRPNEILSPQPIPAQGFIPPGQLLQIPNVLGKTASSSALLPDSEVIDSPSAVGFDLQGFINQAGGYLSTYSERVDGETLTGAQIVQRVASQNSINPRLLLSLLEHEAGWVYGQPKQPDRVRYPLGWHISGRQGLYQELSITATQLSKGYYGWRQGILLELQHPKGAKQRIHPGLNAGSVALQHSVALLNEPAAWESALYGPDNLIQTHQRMFGDPWQRASQVEPLLPAGLAQPILELPFLAGERWSFTGGPHASWNSGSPRGALDFAPVTGEPPCAVSRAWVTAPAPGVVVRSSDGVLALDLDGDGNEQTGWVLVFLHLAEAGRLAVGTVVEQDAPLGHPSCEGGRATGTHVHLARKYNGEWLSADWPVPFVMGGWQATAGAKIYSGELVKGEQVVSANPGGPRTSIITR